MESAGDNEKYVPMRGCWNLIVAVTALAFAQSTLVELQLMKASTNQ
jgi:hypothetical protein